MAFFRALETARAPGRRLFDDPFAVTFLNPRLRRLAALSRFPPAGAILREYIDRRWPGVRTSAIARTRFIDDAVETGLAEGMEQVTILGAGFDARAYRIPAMRHVPVFEVDHPSTSATKRAAVEATLGSIPALVRFIAVDFNAESWQTTMADSGYDANRRTLFIWEGVTNYLTAGAVDATLRWCGRAPAGSKVIFTYIDSRVLDEPQAFVGTDRLIATLAAASERWTFGLDPTGVSGFLARRGLALDTNVGASDYRARYFGRQADRMRGYEFYRIAVARVPAAQRLV